MSFKTHNQGYVPIDGTHLQGYVTATFGKLRATFGEPMDGDGHKVDAEWHVKFDSGVIATVYNWKNGRAYLGEDGKSVLEINEWNVGGHSKDAATMIERALQGAKEPA